MNAKIKSHISINDLRTTDKTPNFITVSSEFPVILPNFCTLFQLLI